MKTWNLILAGVFLLGLPAVVQAQFAFTTNNGAITITGYTGTSGNVVVPDTIDGYPVTTIAAFYSDTTLTNFTIPASVTNLATDVFLSQTSLTAITVAALNAYYSSSNGVLFNKNQTFLIQAPGGLAGSYTNPATVTTIDGSAFDDCGSLVSVAIDAGVTNIGSEAFVACQSLTAINVDQQCLFYSSTNGILFDKLETTLIQAPGGITGSPAIPASVTSIGAAAFAGCASLTDIMIPDSVTNVGSEAFESCDGLTNVTLGANVAGIGDYAFDYCSSLTRFTIPASVTSIGVGSFQECIGLTGISLGTNLLSIGDSAFYYSTGLTSFSIPDSVTNIGNRAFEYCSGLTNVSIGAGVTTIGSDAFASCTSLTGIHIPKSVTNIVGTVSVFVRIGGVLQPVTIGPVEMVANCSRLTAITVDEQNPFYSSANGILFNKAQTALIEAPGAFAGSYGIPGGVTSVGGEAFLNCAGLSGISIPGSVTNIGAAAFADCGSLTAMTVDGQSTMYRSINGVLFDKAQTTLIQFPGGSGGSYTVSNGVTVLGTTAFSGCSNLTTITLPTSITNVENSTFLGCSKAGIYFAGNAPGITYSPSFPNNLVEILIPFPGSNFYNPNAAAVYYLPGTTGWSASFDGLPAYLWVPPFVCATASSSLTINGYNGSGGAITIPDTLNGLPVTAIASGAFDNADGVNLTNIVIGAKVATIGEDAFAACTGLTSITIPNSVTSLGSGAFAFCDNLKSVYFQGNAPSAGGNVFFDWSDYPIFPPIYEPPTPTTVYYFPGTTGWGSTFAGQPAVLWNPQAETSDASFGVRSSHFGFNITGATNLTVVVEAATNLSDPDWQPVQTNTLTTGSAYFGDPEWTNYPSRFYRFRSP